MVEIAAGIVLAVAILGLAVAILVTLPIWLPWLVVGVGLLVAIVAVVLTVWGLVYVAQTEPLAFALIGSILAWLIWYGYEEWRLGRNETKPNTRFSAMANDSP
jgi:predicted tellurium resistance membrane protein TerC